MSSVIQYGGTKEIILRQLGCDHEDKHLHGPCIDDVSRYYKCLKCSVLIRDMTKCAFLQHLGYTKGELPVGDLCVRP